MATVERSSLWSDDRRSSEHPPQSTGEVRKTPKARLHRLAAVRRQQGVSLRSAARQLGKDIRTVRIEERDDSDIRLSELYDWQAVLGVPVADLLVDPGSALSSPVLERARMVRIMKTAKALNERTESPAAKRLAETLITQLLEIMPELEDVGAWHTVGQRRSLDEYGRAAERVVPDEVFQRFDR